MGDEIVIFITASSIEEGEKISRQLIEKKIAACANISPNLRSIFYWEDKICNEEEVLIIVKSRAVFFDQIEKCVKENHSYSVPEIIALPIIKGSIEYLDWVKKSTIESAMSSR
ncbi:MAG: divalent-cation tolerance protein CutA [Nitrospirota bacterium]